MNKLIHFGDPPENHKIILMILADGDLLGSLRLGLQFFLAAFLLPFSWALKKRICIGVEPIEEVKP